MTIQALRAAPVHNPLTPASPTAPPVLFEPPGALTDKRHEVWVAAGGPAGWGGCHVWGSVDDASYDHVGIILRGSVVGTLASPLPADPEATLHVNVAATRGEIHPGSDRHADMLVTLCWVDGELLAHAGATLVGAHEYRLAGLRRGVLGTQAKEHGSGVPFARLGQAVFKMPYPAHWVGATVYAKFPAFNEFGLQQQELDAVPSYSLILTGASAK